MNYLGIDYGRKKIGLSLSYGKLAEPLKVIRYIDLKKLIEQIKQIIQREKIDKVIIGLSEGKMAEETKNFCHFLQNNIKISVETFDETLTSHDAIDFSIQGGIKRKKRKIMEDSYAASIILQNYIDYFE